MTVAITPKEHSIPFTDAMMHEVLAGTKTQTRRINKNQPAPHAEFYELDMLGNAIFTDGTVWRSKYGVPGDTLWVRETHAIVPTTAFRCSEGVVMTINPNDPAYCAVYRTGWVHSQPGKWRPPMFTFRWASRILLEVVDVRVERVQQISEADAIAEGLPPRGTEVGTIYGAGYTSARDAYCRLWNDINEARGFGWGKNPFCWVVTFASLAPHPDAEGERCERTTH